MAAGTKPGVSASTSSSVHSRLDSFAFLPAPCQQFSVSENRCFHTIKSWHELKTQGSVSLHANQIRVKENVLATGLAYTNKCFMPSSAFLISP